MVQGNIKRVSAVIPAKNESRNIGKVVEETKRYVDAVLVIDDSSIDNTREVARSAGAKVIQNEGKGYLKGIKTGFGEAKGDIVVTLDGDGEHNPGEMPLLTWPILNGKADLVLGKREKIERISERVISFVTRLKTGVTDSGTGFRAMKRELALKLNLKGRCICGISVLEAHYLGARITEVPITVNNVKKKRKTAWYHILQLFYVLRWAVK